jgi:hypothetical protein
VKYVTDPGPRSAVLETQGVLVHQLVPFLQAAAAAWRMLWLLH